MTPENFEALLAYLCPEDREEAGRRYSVLHAKLTGFFRLRGMYDPEADADDALDRAGEKIRKGYNIPEILKFCIGIARKIVFERLRQRRREETAFLKFLEDASTETLEKLMNLMRRCLKRSPVKDRFLLFRYCRVPPGVDRAEHRLRLARRHNWSIEALRIRVTRIRDRLKKCMRHLRDSL